MSAPESTRSAGLHLSRRPLLLVNGATRTVQRLLGHPHLGQLVQPRSWNAIAPIAVSGAPWAADNDALARIDPDAYLTMLDRIAAADRARLLFVTVPDAVERRADGTIHGDWQGTRWLWQAWRGALTRRGLPTALVAQDGATVDSVPWDELAALFIGGSDEFKEGVAAASLIHAAKQRGRWVHVGRVNSARRERLLLPLGVDSFDGGQYSRYSERYIAPCLQRLEVAQCGLARFDEDSHEHGSV